MDPCLQCVSGDAHDIDHSDACAVLTRARRLRDRYETHGTELVLAMYQDAKITVDPDAGGRWVEAYLWLPDEEQ